MKEIYQNKDLRIFILDNGTYRVEAKDFVDPEQYILYAKGDTIQQAVARMHGRAEKLRDSLDHLIGAGSKKALDWSEESAG